MATKQRREEKLKKLVQSLIAKRQELSEEASPEEIMALLLRYIRKVEINPILAAEDNRLVVDEATRRRLTSVTWLSDEDLLAEVQRRSMSMVKAAMDQAEFDREARERGYHRSLKDFPISEISSYLRIQGI